MIICSIIYYDLNKNKALISYSKFPLYKPEQYVKIKEKLYMIYFILFLIIIELTVNLY